MHLTNHQTVKVCASYVSLSAYDNEICITDESGDRLTIKGLTTSQVDGICCDWIRSRVTRNASLMADYPFSSLSATLQETADV